MNPAERIEQFRKMAQANPEDDLAHFALGQLLCDEARWAEAVNVLRHVVKISSSYSRAYLLLGLARSKSGDEPGAIQAWQQGYAQAMALGDLMPASEMKGFLGSVGAAPDPGLVVAPPEAAPEDDREPEEGEIRCLRSGRIGAKMEFNPFGDEIGAFIEAQISKESWEEWMELSIKLINEFRLDLGDPQSQRVYDEHMREFLKLPEELFNG